jgi:hypothetical protein
MEWPDDAFADGRRLGDYTDGGRRGSPAVAGGLPFDPIAIQDNHMNSLAADLVIDANFPGGNIIVDSIDGDTVRLRQDRRTTTEWWFYWLFRIQGTAGRTIRFEFTDGDVITAAGPCYSAEGDAWRWLGRSVVVGNSFSHTFGADEHVAYFSMGIPYVGRQLDAFLAGHPSIGRRVLTRTEGGRDAELLELHSKRREHVVFLSARTHACEAVASYAHEGMLEFWLNDASGEGAFLRDRVDLLVVPFVDKDGVEVGDQGKLRSPHDHNRDFIDTPLYATTRAIRTEVHRHADRLVAALDLHCPWIRGHRNEDAYFVGPVPPGDQAVIQLAKLLEQSQRGEIPLRADTFLPHGVAWTKGLGHTLASDIRRTTSVRFAATFEIPYGLSSGVTMTVPRARALGGDLARAIAVYLQANATRHSP